MGGGLEDLWEGRGDWVRRFGQYKNFTTTRTNKADGFIQLK